MSSQRNPSEIHQLVAEQYDKFPYPAAEDNLTEFIRNRAFQAGCPSQFFHLYWPYKPKNLQLDILVAGCGTMQAPKFAVNLPGARITAIDLCEHSIQHTNKLLQKHGISNVSTHNLPIEEISTLGETFDLIISTGVLHHLPEPVAGLRALESVLREDGSMYLMLYGKYGRDGIYYMQDLFRRAGLNASSVTREQLSTIRQIIGNLPDHHPLAAKAHYFRNFEVGDEELVDLFLHPQDKGYSVPDIADFLEQGNMQLQSMLFRAHYAPVCSGLADLDLMNDITQLDELEQFSIVELYRAAALMHFFIACKKGRDAKTFQTNLNNHNWKSLVPVAAPAVVQDTLNVPDGFSANLYSPIHQFEDIRCPVTAEERTLFSLVNGQTTIGEIQGSAKKRCQSLIDDELVRQFFRKLFDYDYVSFRGSTGTQQHP